MIKVNICSLLNMLVAFACVRTSIMYKCFKFGISARNARNVKSQILCNYGKSSNNCYLGLIYEMAEILTAIKKVHLPEVREFS